MIEAEVEWRGVPVLGHRETLPVEGDIEKLVIYTLSELTTKQLTCEPNVKEDGLYYFLKHKHASFSPANPIDFIQLH